MDGFVDTVVVFFRSTASFLADVGDGLGSDDLNRQLLSTLEFHQHIGTPPQPMGVHFLSPKALSTVPPMAPLSVNCCPILPSLSNGPPAFPSAASSANRNSLESAAISHLGAGEIRTIEFPAHRPLGRKRPCRVHVVVAIAQCITWAPSLAFARETRWLHGRLHIALSAIVHARENAQLLGMRGRGSALGLPAPCERRP